MKSRTQGVRAIYFIFIFIYLFIYLFFRERIWEQNKESHFSQTYGFYQLHSREESIQRRSGF